MGRIKTTAVKRLARQAISHNPKAFTADFAKNKQVLHSITPIESKKIRNIVAGYITKETKRTAKAA